MVSAPVRKTPMMRTLEAAYGQDIRRILQDRYRETGSIPGVARALAVSKESVYAWVDLLDGSETLEFAGWDEEQAA